MINLKELNGTKEKIPELGLGTWKMGGNPKDEKEAIQVALKSGMKFIDTAEMYATEWLVGGAVKNKKKVFIATKVSPSHFSRKDLINSCNASLRNLGVDAIDLYQ